MKIDCQGRNVVDSFLATNKINTKCIHPIYVPATRLKTKNLSRAKSCKVALKSAIVPIKHCVFFGSVVIAVESNQDYLQFIYYVTFAYTQIGCFIFHSL